MIAFGAAKTYYDAVEDLSFTSDTLNKILAAIKIPRACLTTAHLKSLNTA